MISLQKMFQKLVKNGNQGLKNEYSHIYVQCAHNSSLEHTLTSSDEIRWAKKENAVKKWIR